MTKLATLRSQLGGLRRARSAVRSATAWSSLVTAVLWALAGVFVLDLCCSSWSLCRGWSCCSWRPGPWSGPSVRYTRPLLGQRESEIDMALLVERQQQIDSDLVAALQFESPEAARWGSPQLETAVIDYVAAVGRGINVFEGFSREQMTRRGLVLAITVLTLLALGRACSPAMRRPSSTACCSARCTIRRSTRDRADRDQRQAVLDAAEHGSQPATCKAAQGRPLSFSSSAGGAFRPRGACSFTSLGAVAHPVDRSSSSRWPKPKSPRSGPPNREGQRHRLHRRNAAADGQRLVQGLPGRCLDRRGPDRYGSAADDRDAAGARSAALCPAQQGLVRSDQPAGFGPGRHVDRSDRPVHEQQAAGSRSWMLVEVAGKDETSHELVKTDANGLAWTLPEKESPLANIRQELRYEIQVTDDDGLCLESPIRGTIRIRPDRPPTGSAEVVHKVVLPTAEPVIEYRATDDFGLSKIALVAEVERFDPRPKPRAAAADRSGPGRGPACRAEEVPAEIHRFELLAGKPLLATACRWPVATPSSLSPLKLAKGDRVKLTLEVTDYRGENDQGQPVGQSHASDALVLEISDESGVLAAISRGRPAHRTAADGHHQTATWELEKRHDSERSSPTFDGYARLTDCGLRDSLTRSGRASRCCACWHCRQPPSAADADAFRRKQQAQEKARGLAGELVGAVLDIQLRQLEENGLKGPADLQRHRLDEGQHRRADEGRHGGDRPAPGEGPGGAASRAAGPLQRGPRQDSRGGRAAHGRAAEALSPHADRQAGRRGPRSSSRWKPRPTTRPRALPRAASRTTANGSPWRRSRTRPTCRSCSTSSSRPWKT